MILFFKKHWNLLNKNSEPEILTSTQNFHLLKNKILIQLTHIAMVQRLWSWALGKMVLWEASRPAIVMSSRVPWPRGGSKVGYKGHTIDKACQSHSETSPGYHEWVAIFQTALVYESHFWPLGHNVQTMSNSHFMSFFTNSEVTLR